jgi:outer membrane biosynthesis protein TonB
VARNEEGEFELILGNRQLLSVFFLVVLLLGLCFVGGYVLGRGAAPVLNATNEIPPQEPAKQVVVATQTPAPKAEPEPVAAPTQTAPQTASVPAPPPVAAPEPPKAKATPKQEAVKAAPPKPEPPKPAPVKPAPAAAAKAGPATSTPIPGRVYLQLSATDKVKAETMVDLLRGRSLPGMAAPIADRPGLYRVLVGPMAESGVQDMRNKLKAAGFPADQAIKRTF